MKIYSQKISGKKVIINISNRICESSEELICSDLFIKILQRCIKNLKKRESLLLDIFKDGDKVIDKNDSELLVEVFRYLVSLPKDLVPKIVPGSAHLFKDPEKLNDFVEYLYNYWRSFDRFIICTSPFDDLEKRPYRTFNETIERLTHLVRYTYRNIQENITGGHPRIYRQVRAGSELAAIALRKKAGIDSELYKKLDGIPFIRQILLYPPLVLDPPMNKRTGKFVKVDKNPLTVADIEKEDWICYPAKVGKLLINIYINNKFYELGFSLCNLFELATDEDIKKRPDAVYLFGLPGDRLDGLAEYPTVFFDDEKERLLVAAVPDRDEFGYFGYLKKMVLTLHNIVIMKQGIMPFHGALFKLNLKKDREVTILVIGDTGAGKSETLEALRLIGSDMIRDMFIIADDMGSLEIRENGIIGYGTEIGAFLRLDDLQAGYAFGQMDRAIIMSPGKINSRIVIPVNTFDNIIKGHPVDLVLYANNYDDVDEDHLIIERIMEVEQALTVFKEGKVMSKGTTTSTGITSSYFANIFGPPQYMDLHEDISRHYFETFYEKGLFVGQMRTRLGVKGFEMKGPEEAAKRLLGLISE